MTNVEGDKEVVARREVGFSRCGTLAESAMFLVGRGISVFGHWLIIVVVEDAANGYEAVNAVGRLVGGRVTVSTGRIGAGG